MPPKPGFLDGLTRLDELLVDNTAALGRLIDVLQAKGDVTKKPLFLAYPSPGPALITIEKGTTILNFETGTITDINGDVTDMKQSLQSRGFEWARSFFVQSDKLMSVQIDDNDPIIADVERDASGINQQFKKISLIAYEDTEVFVIISTSPDALISMIGNATIMMDPKDVFGDRTYIGAGELAARLGSIKTFEKRGEVVLMDDFKNSKPQWFRIYIGTGSMICRSNTYARHGNYSLKIVTGDNSADYAHFAKSIPYMVLSKMGFEASILIGSDIEFFYMQLRHYDGAKKHYAKISYYPQTSDLTILNDAGGGTTIDGDLSLVEADYLFHTFKFTVDFPNNKYGKLIVDNNIYDISGYDLYTADSTLTPYIQVKMYVDNYATGNHYIYVDDIILTQNEP